MSGNSSLLDPLRAESEWQGRENWGMEYQLNSLVAWCVENPARLAIRTIAAPAGAGKTRLARELMRRVKERSPEWQTDFFPARPVSPAVLLVVDHAASAVPELRRLAEGASGRLRLLLLERWADVGRGWLGNLLGDLWIGEELGKHASYPPGTVCSPNDRVREQIFESVLQAGSRESGEPAPAYDRSRFFEGRPASEEWTNPGYLSMAAMESFQSAPLQVFRQSAKMLARQIARREAAAAAGLVGDAWLAEHPTYCSQAGIFRVVYAVLEFEEREELQQFLMQAVASVNAEELEIVDGMLPHDRPALAAVAVAVALRLLAAVRESDDPPQARARTLYRLARRLRDLGQEPAALAAAVEAASLYRELGAGYELQLAFALLDQAALGAAAEAVDICRRLAAATPLARSLSHYGDRLGEGERWAEACEAYRESISILAPGIPNLPNHVISLVSVTMDDYKRSCRKLRLEPDAGLIGPLEEFFAR